MNFETVYTQGQQGFNRGLSMGEGLSSIDSAVNGTQKGRLIGVAGAPKSGKSTLVDAAFVIAPYLEAINNPSLKVTWIYFSFEIARVAKEFDFCVYFMYLDYGITDVLLDDGITKDGKNKLELSADLLRGRIKDDLGEMITLPKAVHPVHNLTVEQMMISCYRRYIEPLFGVYNTEGICITPGRMFFITNRDNPTGLRNLIMDFAKSRGKFLKEGGKTNGRITGYKAGDPEETVIIVTDHLRKLLQERGFDKKQTVDKMVEYQCELRDWCNYVFVDIIHLNRAMSDVARQRHQGDRLYPNSDDVKDTGNLAEDCDYLYTIMNPNDQRYGLVSHFGNTIKTKRGEAIYPNLRSIHLVESRHCAFPQHFSVNMFGGTKTFEKVNFNT